MLMAIYMKAIGKMIKLMVKESSNTLEEVHTKECGKTISEMERVVNLGLMALITVECIPKAKSMVLAISNLLIKAHILEGSIRMKCVVMENTNGLMERCTKAVGQKIKCLVKAYL